MTESLLICSFVLYLFTCSFLIPPLLFQKGKCIILEIRTKSYEIVTKTFEISTKIFKISPESVRFGPNSL